MIETVDTIVVNKSPADIFRFVANVENIPQWVHGSRIVKLSEGAFEDGTLFQEGHVVLRVQHLQVDRGFETESIRINFPTRFVLKQTHGKLQFEEVEWGTQVTLKHRVELQAYMKPLEQLVAKKAQQESHAALEQLKRLLEQKKR